VSYYQDMKATPELESTQREVLSKGFIRDAREIVRQLERPGALDETLKIRMRAMTRELQDDLGELTASRSSPELAAVIARPVLELARAVLDTSDVDSVAARDRIALAFLAVVQTLEADEESQEIWLRSDAASLTDWLIRQLDITHEALGEWLGVSSRTIQRWVSGEVSPSSEQAPRLRALARIVAQLRFVYPPRGVAQFLKRPVAHWDQRSTVEILDDEELVRQAEAAARMIRG
jgi:uncharacterized protein (DUF2384 family)